MKLTKIYLAIIASTLFCMNFFIGCNQTSADLPTKSLQVVTETRLIVPTKTVTIMPSLTFTFTPTETFTFIPTKTATITPSPTLLPQTIGRIFPEGFDSPGVWSNNWDSTYPDRLHFDIGLPYNLETGIDSVIAPLNGQIIKVYEPQPDAGEVLDINATLPINGLNEFVESLGYDSSNITEVRFYIAHITPLKTSGEILAGEPIGTAYDGWWNVNVIGFVFTVYFSNGSSFQFSPCELPTKTEFCGTCYPGTPLPCP